MSLDTAELLPPFENPHFDAVTGLATLNNYLISGSKDKNLKLWNLDAPSNNHRNTSYAHNDYINSVIRNDCLIQATIAFL
jgi:WD40 repeat protein